MKHIRDFSILLSAAAFCAAAMSSCASIPTDSRPSSAAPAGKSYSISVLGDVHYEAPPLERFHLPNKSGLFKGNTLMWEKDMPSMLAASASLVGDDTSFALQLGDLIAGASRGFNAQTQMLAEATAVLEKTYPGLPVLSVCGNHDYMCGQGDHSGVGRNAYNTFMPQWLARQAAKLTTNAVTSTTFGFRHGPDLWVFVNYNDGAATVPILEKLFEENPSVRYTFIAIHAPVLPMDLFKFRWFYLGDERQNGLRRKVRAMLAKRNAIVIAGHVHMLEYKDWYGDGGRITEIVLNSVTRYGANFIKPAVPDVRTETPDDYGAWLKTAPKSDYNTRFDALYEEYRPGLKARYAAAAAGHHILRVSDAGVTLEYYGHDATTPTKIFTLR